MKLFDKSIGLSLFRVIVAFLLIKKAIFLLPMASELYGVTAIVPYRFYQVAIEAYNLEFIEYPFHVFLAPQLFLVLMIIVAALYMFGVFRGVTGLVLLLMLTILRLRNGFILDGSDNVIQVVLPFLIFADCYKYFTLNPSKYDREERSTISILNTVEVVGLRRFINNLALLAIMIQICFVYFFTAIAKLQGELWINGTAIYYTMRVEEFRATSWNIPLTENHYFVVLGTYFTIFWELCFIFLVWFRQTKFIVLFLGILLHIGIFIFMRIDDFSWIMIASYCLFITDHEYNSIGAYYNSFKEWILTRIFKLKTPFVSSIK